MYCLHLYYTENFGENQISDKSTCDIFLKKNIKFLKFVVFCSQRPHFSVLENKKLPEITGGICDKRKKAMTGIFLMQHYKCKSYKGILK